MPDINKVDTTPLHWNTLTHLNGDTQRHTAQGIRNGMTIAFSDSYFKVRWVTSAIVIERGRHNDNIITGTCTTPVKREEQEAYQSELTGIFPTIFIVENIF